MFQTTNQTMIVVYLCWVSETVFQDLFQSFNDRSWFRYATRPWPTMRYSSCLEELCFNRSYPLVNIQKTMENHHV
jgi:hypothetical protein